VFLNLPPETDANARLYKADLDERGFVMNLSRLWGWRPEIAEGFRNLRNVLTDESTLSKRELGVIVCATAASLGDSYCALAWGRSLSTAADPTTAAAVLRGTESQGLTARDRAISKWARKVVQDPNATTSVDVEDLRMAGFTEREIIEATAFIAFRLAFSTINDALGVRPDMQVAAAAPAEVREAVTFGRPAAERAS
jgi:uncharacterized peroxidase-related enzyme